MEGEVCDFDRKSLHNFSGKGNKYFGSGILVYETLEIAFKYGSVEKLNLTRIWKGK